MMSDPNLSTVAENVRRARTLRGVTPDRYLVPFRSVAELLERQTAAAPDKVFLFYHNDDTGERSESRYRDFNGRINQVANLLRDDYGVRRGDKVATLAFNHPDGVIVCFACWKLGAVATPQNAAEDDNHIAFILQNAECHVMLVATDYAGRGNILKTRVPCLEHVVVMDAAYQARLNSLNGDFVAPAENMLEDQALLVYTSGTTGAPKGVMLSQYNLLIDCKSAAEWQGLTSDVRMMCVLPVHHVNGLCMTHVLPLYAGGSVVLNRGFKATTFWRRLAQHQVNIVSVVPTILQFLCEADEDISRLNLKCLSHILCGAGTLSV
ncbi:MAG: class I adenylate-forming enzyme family protein, partial [Burkholderiales bacterium]